MSKENKGINEEVLMPIFDYVILERDEEKKSLIIEPENRDPRAIPMLELKVLYVGPDCLNVKPGDQVIFNAVAAISFAYDHHTYWLIGERGIGTIVSKLRKIHPVPDVRRLPR